MIDPQLYNIVVAASSCGASLLWLVVAGLGVWRLRVARKAGLLLILAGTIGFLVRLSSPIMSTVVALSFGSVQSLDTLLIASTAVSVLAAALDGLAHILLIAALWALLRPLPS